MAPTSRYIFDIRFVENQEQLFQLGKLYTYELRCERMNYSHERVTTPVAEIDAGPQRSAYTIDLLMAAGGSGAYLYEEQVWQGINEAQAYATGMVISWDVEAHVLQLQNITGTFTNAAVVGADSGASWIPSDIPIVAPSSHDPISDNRILQTEGPEVVINRGSNPRHT